jgi:hypothetical protein
MSWPVAFMASMPRQDEQPPEPPSCGIVSAMRSSKAPATSAPLPKREQPVTAMRSGSMPASGVAISASMMRLAPHAHAISAPALWSLP